ncbi:MAG: NAD+ synthase [Planctomycetota bacterium]
MKVGLAPINPTVGDFEGNAQRCLEAIRRCAEQGADVVVLPELVTAGYPPRDLLFRDDFIEGCDACAQMIAASAPKGVAVAVGLPQRVSAEDRRLHNALRLYQDGKLVASYAKRLLPTYDVFDEDRYFVAGNAPVVAEGFEYAIGLSVCEDAWHGEDAGVENRYEGRPDPIAELASNGAKLIVNPSASPFVAGKQPRQRDVLARMAATHGAFIAAVNQLGANDDVIFDGVCRLYRPDDTLVAATEPFSGESIVVDLEDAASANAVDDPASMREREDLVFQALVLGVRDYFRKTGFRRALIGISGGIDSALTATIATAALGKANVIGVAMPTKFSSEHSLEDARELATRLGIELLEVPIETGVEGLRGMTASALAELHQPGLGEQSPDLADENLQSRLRGTLLMTLSNRLGALVLTTGNKSEYAVGYCTLYGDMNGALAVLCDVPKTLVYDVARWTNANASAAGFERSPIPERTITKPPSAELRPGQLDVDSLPDYDVLDEIVDRHVDSRQSPDRITSETGFDAALVRRICRLIDINEYKRRQAAIGLKVTQTAFGPGRRIPVARS